MGSGLMWDDAEVCDERMDMKIFVRDSFDKWKYFKSKSVPMFSDPLILCEYRNNSLLTIVYPRYQDTVLWSSFFNGSNEAL